MSRIPRQARGPRKRFFEAEGVDELLCMVLELTAEVSTLRERQYVTERVLEKHGLTVGTDVERYELTTGDEEALTAERDRLLQTVLRVLEAETPEDGVRDAPGGDPSQTRAA